jgi:hypothetical protein
VVVVDTNGMMNLLMVALVEAAAVAVITSKNLSDYLVREFWYCA